MKYLLWLVNLHLISFSRCRTSGGSFDEETFTSIDSYSKSGTASEEIRTKKKIYNVRVLISPAYIAMYEQTHSSLAKDLKMVAMAMESAFNNTTMAKSNGYEIGFELFTPKDNPLIGKMTPSICEGSITNIISLLNDINNLDNTHHYILLLPCPPTGYTEIFNSVGVDVPIIDHHTNVQCAKRIAVLYEFNVQQLFSSFSNALLKILGAPSSHYNTILQSSSGDEGLKSSITIGDNTVYSILNSKCFINAR